MDSIRMETRYLFWKGLCLQSKQPNEEDLLFTIQPIDGIDKEKLNMRMDRFGSGHLHALKNPFNY